MKKTTKRILEFHPKIKDKLNGCDNITSLEDALKGMDEREGVFLKLAWYFEYPEDGCFDISVLYKHLNDDWLEFALELITRFFREDTFLIQKPTYSFIKDGSDFLSQSQFADYLTKQGLRYDRQKLNLYYERGKVPQPDLVVGGVKYWSKAIAQSYCEQEKKRVN